MPAAKWKGPFLLPVRLVSSLICLGQVIPYLFRVLDTHGLHNVERPFAKGLKIGKVTTHESCKQKQMEKNRQVKFEQKTAIILRDSIQPLLATTTLDYGEESTRKLKQKWCTSKSSLAHNAFSSLEEKRGKRTFQDRLLSSSLSFPDIITSIGRLSQIRRVEKRRN